MRRRKTFQRVCRTPSLEYVGAFSPFERSVALPRSPRLRLFLLGILVLLAGTQLLAAGTLFRFFLDDHMTHAVQDNLRLARSLAKRCDGALLSMRENLQGVARLLREAASADLAPTLLQAALAFNRAFETLQYLDDEGQLRLMAPPDPDQIGLDLSSQTSFRTLRRGKTFYWSDAFLSSPTNSLAVTAALPVFPGYLEAQLRLTDLSEIVRTVAVLSGDFAAVVDHFGTVIAHSDAEALWHGESYGNAPLVRRSMAGQEASGKGTLRNEVGLVSAVPIAQTRWSVVVFRPWEGVMAPAEKARRAMVTLLLASYLLLVGGGAIFLLRLSRSLRRFSESAQRIAQGSFREHIAVDFREFSDLAASFRRMQKQLFRREHALRESEERHRSLVEVAPGGIVLLDVAGNIRRANARAVALLRCASAAELEGQRGLSFLPPDRQGRAQELAREALKKPGHVHHIEERVLRQDGTSFLAELLISGIRSPEGDPAGLVLVLQDISERKTTELALRQALADKETLLREVHHRVKNNLQVICSMMDLQSRKAQSPNLAAAIRESRGRILTMSAAHDMLYRTSSFAEVSMRAYVEHLLGIHRFASETPPRLSFEVDGTGLPLDQAIPCGLILNELVCNALRHAFVGRSPGEVVVRLHSEGRVVHLAVHDDGTGMPPDATTTKGLGFTIVTALAAQLDGTFTVKHAGGDLGGSSIDVAFPLLDVTPDPSESWSPERSGHSAPTPGRLHPS